MLNKTIISYNNIQYYTNIPYHMTPHQTVQDWTMQCNILQRGAMQRLSACIITARNQVVVWHRLQDKAQYNVAAYHDTSYGQSRY